jgi:DNA-binding response OmpR family regulator
MSKLAYVIEDDPDLAKIYTEAMKMAGFTVETILDGQSAYDRIKEHRPDFVLLDMHLPRVSGNEILWLTWFDDLLDTLKFTIITADPDMGRIYEPKGYTVLIKPVPFDALVEMGKEVFADTQKENRG